MWASLWGGAAGEKPALPAPKTKEDYEALRDSMLIKLKELIATTDGWTQHSEQDGFTLWEKVIDPADSIHLIKTTGELPVSVTKADAIISDTNIETRKKWDSEVAFYKVAEEITPNILVSHVGFTAPFPVAGRDFVSIRCTMRDSDDVHYSWGCSIDYPAIPEDPSGTYVRGRIVITGFVLKPIAGEPDKCSIINIAQVDPMGMIPGWVVNLSKGKALARSTNLKKLFEEEEPTTSTAPASSS
eukprot:TRINITY_DN16268_c0_g1_i1.p1 TRINITY_DN16268_c0_g1~~TRINITY_DN16268_c0_g1_i1.p1  ORF type:complete len:255 (+),score=48.65 TRINITY_DN16268_c0_g1_i1:37-765(+)